MVAMVRCAVVLLVSNNTARASGGQPYVFRLIRRAAGLAGIPSADRLSPHSLRHTYATLALDSGAPLRDVQDALDHADPRTTRRYDRSRHNLDRSPSYAVAARLGG
jgi:integrase/recombinase XerD